MVSFNSVYYGLSTDEKPETAALQTVVAGI